MKYRSNSILAYLPQNRDGERILKQILFFQEALGMRIFLMDVIKSRSFFSSKPKSKKNQIRHQGALNKLTEFVKKVVQKEIPDNIILRIGWGNIVSTLINESKRGGHEFVILDKSEKRNAGSLSKADIDRYVSKSHCPVLTINKDFPINRVNKIVIPIDISQRTKKRLYWATFFAKKLNAKIKIVSALNIDIKATKSLAFKNAEKLKKMLESRGLECEVKILKIHDLKLHQAVLNYIEEEKPEMVIIRTHQEIRFSGRKIGKFVSEIIHGCTMPVFSVGGVTQNYDIDSIK
jgi:nucleotide-binding universal stress UspA family protein